MHILKAEKRSIVLGHNFSVNRSMSNIFLA
jgi:hypothetical protein